MTILVFLTIRKCSSRQTVCWGKNTEHFSSNEQEFLLQTIIVMKGWRKIIKQLLLLRHHNADIVCKTLPNTKYWDNINIEK